MPPGDPAMPPGAPATTPGPQPLSPDTNQALPVHEVVSENLQSEGSVTGTGASQNAPITQGPQR
jgi:hypothetical protein